MMTFQSRLIATACAFLAMGNVFAADLFFQDDFEAWAETHLTLPGELSRAGWMVQGLDGATGSIDTVNTLDGRALRMTRGNTAGTVSVNRAASRQAVTGGQSLFVRVWARRVSPSAELWVGLQEYGSTGSPLANLNNLQRFALSDTFQPCFMVVDASVNTASVALNLQVDDPAQIEILKVELGPREYLSTTELVFAEDFSTWPADYQLIMPGMTFQNNWRLFGVGSAAGSYTIRNDGGGQYFRFDRANTDSDAALDSDNNKTPITEETDLTFRVWARAVTSGAKMTLAVPEFHAGGYSGFNNGGVYNLTDSFKMYETRCRTSPNTIQVHIAIRAGGISTFDVDRFEFYQSSPVDDKPPVITLNGGTTLTVPQGQAFAEPGATAIDAVEGDVSSSIIIGGGVDTSTPGLYRLTYDATDSMGNAAARVTRSVYVMESWLQPGVTLLISEFMASNKNTLTDADGDWPDWIELHAPAGSVNLGGWYLTDDAGNLTKWRLPSQTLASGGYLVVFASGKNRAVAGSQLHTNFSLSAGGEYLALVEPDGVTVAQEFSPAFPEQEKDISYGLAQGTTARRYFDTPTPGAANVGGYAEGVKDTKFSVKRGFFSEPFDLAITTATSGATIKYTLDGSTPSETHGLTCTGPIHITGTTVVRAMAYYAGEGFPLTPTNVDTNTYLFLADVIRQSADNTPPAGWPAGPIPQAVPSPYLPYDQVMDYGMDPDIVDAPRYSDKITSSLLSIPTFCITTDLPNLFDSATGIYANAVRRGREWERPASFELINPDGSEGFQVGCGLRIRGGYGRVGDNPKHSLRLFFRDEYGDSKLRYPLFGDAGADKFDNMDLRHSQHIAYAWNGRADASYIEDVFARDLQKYMGEPHTRTLAYHLYLNGQYWGLFQTQERAEASFAETYFGGDKEEYDVVKAEYYAWNIEATDGNLEAYRRLWEAATAGFETDAKYYRVQGLNPDGTPNPAYEKMVDVDNLIDYMMIYFYTGNPDGPTVTWLDGNNMVNNFYAIYNRVNPDGWKFMVHDAEGAINGNVNTDITGPFQTGYLFEDFNPRWLFQQLIVHPEFRQRFADRVHMFFSNGGPMSPEGAAANYELRANEIFEAMVAESARWGDFKVHPPLNRDDHWSPKINSMLTNYFPQRTGIVLAQLRAKGWYPALDAPVFNQAGGQVEPGFTLVMTTNAGTIYFTKDGSDPRLPGGAIAPGVQNFGTTVQQTLVAAGSVWRYRDDGADLGTAWRAAAYNDTAWASGPAQLGYGDGDEATVIGYGPDAANKYPATYFRRHFNVADASQVASLSLGLLRDDGAVVYLNGTEVARSNMPAGEITAGTYAAGVAGGADETTFYPFSPSAALLVDGDNVLAVQVHQSNAGSSDLSFDLELKAALASGDPVTIGQTSLVSARSYQGGQWSALSQALFNVNTAAAAGLLAISEINYNPYDPSAAELALNPLWTGGDFEFIELLNTSAQTLDLDGVAFAAGITFTFAPGSGTTLASGGRVVLVKNLAAFQARYGTGRPVGGVYSGSLSNSGERLLLTGLDGLAILDFEYGDSGAWPGRADGKGSTLELKNPSGTAPADYGDGDKWRNSSEFLGTPGTAGLGPLQAVVVNEVLAHTDLPQLDTIELLNVTSAPVAIGGWWLSDSSGDYFKFRIPAGTTLAAGGYAVYDADDFNASLGADPKDFGLNSVRGEDVYLMADDGQGLIRFADHVDFGGSLNGESFGRWPDGSGGLYPMLLFTPGEENSGPRVGPVVISELHYNPGDMLNAGDLEFIEIYNPTGAAVDLTHWRLSGGVDFEFKPGTALAAHGVLVVVGFDPADPLNMAKLTAFRQAYGIGTAVALTGGWTGSLSNGGETVRLMDFDEPPLEEPDYYPRIIEDEVNYNDKSPWPEAADGAGASLTRLSPTVWGNAPGSWTAAAPTPGSAFGTAPPQNAVADFDLWQ